jgi:hypothetical protein
VSPAERLSAYRNERAAARAALEQELAAAMARAEAAEANHAAEKSAWTALEAEATRDFGEYERMEAAQWAWLHGEMREPLRRAECERGAARALVKSLQERLAEIRREIGQADRNLTAGKVVTLPSRPAPGQKTAPLVEFDDVIMPTREAAT